MREVHTKNGKSELFLVAFEQRGKHYERRAYVAYYEGEYYMLADPTMVSSSYGPDKDLGEPVRHYDTIKIDGVPFTVHINGNYMDIGTLIPTEE